MPTLEGKNAPNIVFKTRVFDQKKKDAGEENPYSWKDLTTDEVFKGKKIILFGLPGAFTPTCDSTHLPVYERHYEEGLYAAGTKSNSFSGTRAAMSFTRIGSPSW